MTLFQTIRQSDLAVRIQAARSVVIYAAPGVTPAVSDALRSAAARLPGAVIAIIDASAHCARMGYGRFGEVERLVHGGVDVRREPGLRQGLLIVDNFGWAFTLPAELLETDAPENQVAPNAVELTPTQVAALRGELPQPRGGAQSLPSEGSEPGCLGAEALDLEEIEQVKRELQIAPPQPFDIARQVQVYTALVRFVELEMKGWKLEGRRVQLPAHRLPLLATGDRDLRQRIRSSLNVLEDIEDGPLRSLRSEVEEIRKAFCRPVGGMGCVVLVSAQAILEHKVQAVRDKLAETKQAIVAEIQTKLERVVDGLVPEMARAVRADPPNEFVGRYGTSQAGAEQYVRDELVRVFPTADQIVNAMSLRLTFKDVTYSVLKNEAFKDRVLTSFSRSALPGELLTEYDAAKKRVQSNAQHPERSS